MTDIQNLNIRQSVALLLCLSVCFCMVACTEAQIISDLNIALTAAEAILPILIPMLGAAGLPAAKLAAVAGWVQSALNGIDAVTACQATGGTGAQLATCVTASLAAVVAAVPDLAGLPVEIANVVKALATDIGEILSKYGTKSEIGAKVSKKVIHYGTQDQATLAGYRARVAVDHLKIAEALAGK